MISRSNNPGKFAGRPAIWSAELYAHLRYGIDLLQPSPLDAVMHSTVPVLLIHGEAGRSISPRHSQWMANAAPDHVQLWLVPHAGHTMAWAAAHLEFETRLLTTLLCTIPGAKRRRIYEFGTK